MTEDKKKIQKFTDLHAWQAGHELVLSVYQLTKEYPKEERYSLVDQMRCAVISVTSNIAEGFGRGSYKEKAQFYSIAQGSLVELHNQLIVSRDVGYLADSRFKEIEGMLEKTRRLIYGLISKTRFFISSSSSSRLLSPNSSSLISLFVFFLISLFSSLYLPLSAEAATLIKPANTIGMVGWWRFDEGGGVAVNDYSSQGNAGTLISMEEDDWVAGKVGTGVFFDGSGDEYVNVGNSASLNPAMISIVAWIKPASFGPGAGVIIERQYLSSYIFYILGGDDSLVVNINGEDAQADLFIIQTDVWQHVAVTYDGSTARFYVNALPAGVSPMTAGLIASDASDVYIGNEKSLTTPFHGTIDDVRVYSRILSQVEIRQIMEGDRIARYATTPQATGPLSSGLIGHWTFDGTDMNWASGQVSDKSGNSTYGHVIGMATTSAPTDGKSGQALFFDGIDDYVSLPAPTEPVSSIGFWLKVATSTTFQSVTRLNGSASISINSGVLSATGFSSPTIYIDGVESTTINDTRWHYVVVTTDTGITASAFDVGRSSGTSYFGGSIDDVRVYNRVLQTDEVHKLFTAGKVTHDVTFMGSPDLQRGLITMWSFDGPRVDWSTGRVTDVSGQGNHGSIIGMATATAAESGKIGQAFSFDGIDDYVVGTTILNPGLVTVSAWVNLSKLPVQNILIAGFTNGIDGLAFDKNLYIDTNGKVRFYVWPGTPVTTSAPVNPLKLNTWVHVVGMVDGSNAYVYINGEQVGSAVASGSTYTSYTEPNFFVQGKTNTVSVGGGYGSLLIDDVRLYNRAISASEVQQIYSGRR